MAENFTYNLDDVDSLFLEIETIQDGPYGHQCTIEAESVHNAAVKLCNRLVPFFEKNMVKTDKDGNNV